MSLINKLLRKETQLETIKKPIKAKRFLRQTMRDIENLILRQWRCIEPLWVRILYTYH